MIKNEKMDRTVDNKNLMQFKMFGKSAIHDDGFQFYLTVNIEIKIEKLINEMKALSKCIATHEECRNKSWYNAKTTLSINDWVEGYTFDHRFTHNMAKKAYDERKIMYDLLISISENALRKAEQAFLKYPKSETFKPFREDVEREFIIVDYIEDELES